MEQKTRENGCIVSGGWAEGSSVRGVRLPFWRSGYSPARSGRAGFQSRYVGSFETGGSGNSGDAGFSLLEVMAAVVALAAVVVGVSVLTQQTAEEARSVLAAQQIRTVAQATESYLQKNYEVVAGLASADNPVILNVEKLIGDGHLPSGFNSQTPQGQTLCAVVRKTGDNKLQPLIVAETPEGKSGYDDVTLAQIVTQLGAGGGGVYARDAEDETIIRGAMGGWVLEGADKAPFEAADTATPDGDGTCIGSRTRVEFRTGTPTYALWLQDDASLDATLYRDAVPGRPALNTMNTPILMGDGTIRDVGTTCGKLADGATDVPVGALARDTNGKLVSCQVDTAGVRTWRLQDDLYWGDPAEVFADLGTCDAGLEGVTRVVKTGDAAVSGNTGPRAYTCKGTAWTALGLDDGGNLVIPGTLTANGAVTMNGTITVSGKATLSGGMDVTGRSTVNDLQIVNNVTSGSACAGGAADNGRLGRDTNGKILSCQAGVWTIIGSPITDVIEVQGNNACSYTYSNAMCPAGYTVTGGGYVITAYGNPHNSPQEGGKVGNGYRVMSARDSCFRARAICVR